MDLVFSVSAAQVEAALNRSTSSPIKRPELSNAQIEAAKAGAADVLVAASVVASALDSDYNSQEVEESGGADSERDNGSNSVGLSDELGLPAAPTASSNQTSSSSGGASNGASSGIVLDSSDDGVEMTGDLQKLASTGFSKKAAGKTPFAMASMLGFGATPNSENLQMETPVMGRPPREEESSKEMLSVAKMAPLVEEGEEEDLEEKKSSVSSSKPPEKSASDSASGQSSLSSSIKSLPQDIISDDHREVTPSLERDVSFAGRSKDEDPPQFTVQSGQGSSGSASGSSARPKRSAFAGSIIDGSALRSGAEKKTPG